MRSKCVIVIIICILAFWGCGSETTYTDSFVLEDSSEGAYESYYSIETDSSDEEGTELKTVSYDVDLYNIIDASTKDALNALYKNNSLDTYINKRFETSMTTAALTDVANEYVSLWKDEMDYAISQFINSLSEDDVSVFNQAQTSWEQHVDANLKFHSQCLFAGGSASELAYKMTVNLASLYKARTFEIKYLDYIVNGDNANLLLLYNE